MNPPPDQDGMERARDRVGGWLLLERMDENEGVRVFLAQEESEPYRRAAFRILRPGVETDSAWWGLDHRLAIEALNHPGLARLIATGRTPTGRPYYVEELLSGLPITDYCEQQQCDLPSCLRLFVDVCLIVRDLHQNGFIHRQLEPDYILVDRVDGLPRPRLTGFEFGPWRTGPDWWQWLDYALAHPGFNGEFRPNPATFRDDRGPADVRDDIHDLGHVLYALVTGRTCAEALGLRCLGPREIAVRLASGVIPPPREFLAKLRLDAETRPQALDATQLRRRVTRVPRRLDAVVMKCLERDCARRYQSIDALVEDLRNF